MAPITDIHEKLWDGSSKLLGKLKNYYVKDKVGRSMELAMVFSRSHLEDGASSHLRRKLILRWSCADHCRGTANHH